MSNFHKDATLKQCDSCRETIWIFDDDFTYHNDRNYIRHVYLSTSSISEAEHILKQYMEKFGEIPGNQAPRIDGQGS